MAAGTISDLRETNLTRQQIVGVAIALMLFGILEIIASYFVAHAVVAHRVEAMERAAAQVQTCTDRLKSLGFQAHGTVSRIVAQTSGMDDAAFKLGQSSIASLSCPGWKLVQFCMGETCQGGGGIQLDLEPMK